MELNDRMHGGLNAGFGSRCFFSIQLCSKVNTAMKASDTIKDLSAESLQRLSELLESKESHCKLERGNKE